MAVEIQSGTPPGDGICACYVDNPALPVFTERKLLMWFRGEWTYPMSDQKFRGVVYGWVALPVLKKEHFIPQKLETASEYDL